MGDQIRFRLACTAFGIAILLPLLLVIAFVLAVLP